MTTSSSDVRQFINKVSNEFNSTICSILTDDNRVANLKALSVLFSEVCANAECYAAERDAIKVELDLVKESNAKLEAMVSSYDDVLQQLHLLMNCKSMGTDKNAEIIFKKMASEVKENMTKIQKYHKYKSLYSIEIERSERMMRHINELSKTVVLQQIGCRFYAREVAALRQMMDLMNQGDAVEKNHKAVLWDEIETETQLLRVNTLWLMNRINGKDRREAPYECSDDRIQAPPRIVVLMRSHPRQGLGLEITGGSENYRAIVVTGKQEGSMADDDQLQIGDRIIAIDGMFIMQSTHEQVMKVLQDESTKDYVTLVVSEFDPFYTKTTQMELEEDVVLQTAANDKCKK